MELKKAVVVISGASRAEGIGYEVAAQLASIGASVILTARDATAASKRARELSERGLGVIGRLLDVTDPESITTLAAEIEREHGCLDILINNAAGMAPFGEFAATADLALARDVMEVTLFGVWRVTQAMLPLLRKSGHPRIVNVSSGAGSHGDTAFGLTTGNSMGTSYSVA